MNAPKQLDQVISCLQIVQKHLDFIRQQIYSQQQQHPKNNPVTHLEDHLQILFDFFKTKFETEIKHKVKEFESKAQILKQHQQKKQKIRRYSESNFQIHWQDSFFTICGQQSVSEYKKYLPKEGAIQGDRTFDKNQRLENKSRLYVRVQNTKLPVKKTSEVQTERRSFCLQKLYQFSLRGSQEQKQIIKKRKVKGSEQKKLEEIIYGKDLLLFVEQYFSAFKLRKLKKQLSPSTQKNSSQNHELKTNELISFLAEDTILSQPSVNTLEKNINRRLFVLCFDALMFTIRNLGYFFSDTQLVSVIESVKKQQQEMQKQKELAEYGPCLQTCLKDVIKKMRSIRQQLKKVPREQIFLNIDKTIKLKF